MGNGAWTEWTGGGFVPNDYEAVDVMLRDGRIELRQDPRGVMWQHRSPISEEDQVIAYRVSEAQ